MMNLTKQSTLLVILANGTTIFAYQHDSAPSSASRSFARAVRREVPMKPSHHANFLDQKQNQKQQFRPQRYDLGLGKNSPFMKATTPTPTMKMNPNVDGSSLSSNLESNSSTESFKSVYDTVQYLREHESTRALPSPLEMADDAIQRGDSCPSASTAAETIPSAESKPNKTIQYQRALEDVLSIVDLRNKHDDGYARSTTPPTTTACMTIASSEGMPTDQPPKLNLNSVWVEMLIHTQQQRQQAV